LLLALCLIVAARATGYANGEGPYDGESASNTNSAAPTVRFQCDENRGFRVFCGEYVAECCAKMAQNGTKAAGVTPESRCPDIRMSASG
jgi:hypothetical protein